MTLEEVENIDDLVNNLEKLEMPSQVIAVLGDPLLQKYLTMRPSDSAFKRINNWLVTFFEEELESRHVGDSSDPENLRKLLEGVLKYSQFAKVRDEQPVQATSVMLIHH